MERAARFRFEQGRNRFVAARGFLRTLLSRYVPAEPAELEFVYGPFGKPSLAGNLTESGLNFNLAHSDNLALLAVTRIGAIGVDVERIEELRDSDALVAQFFSATERAAFHRLPREQKPPAFFNLWTRKEAWLKATGQGIGHLLNAVEVSFLPGEAARFLRLPGERQSPASWILHPLAPRVGFVGAMAISARNALFCGYHWDLQTAKITLWEKAAIPSD
jgi:4'-phosphopantetheinyl transferase